jgi:hypothetical protein
MAGPANLPSQFVDRLNRGINAAIADQAIKVHLANVGFTAMGGSPADFGNLIASETAKWGGVTRVVGAKAG